MTLLPSHGMFHRPPYLAAERHHGVFHDGAVADVFGRRERIGWEWVFPGLVVDVEGGRIAEEVHVCLPEGGDGSDVLPIPLEEIGKHLFSRVQHGGQHVLSEIFGRIGVGLVFFEIFEEFFLP